MNLQPKLVVPVAPLTELPLLPEVISYYDDFRDCYRQVVGPSSSNEWTISFDGRRAGLDFSGFDGDLRELAKSWCADVLACLSPVTATKYLLGLRRVSAERLMQLVTSGAAQYAFFLESRSGQFSPVRVVSIPEKPYVISLQFANRSLEPRLDRAGVSVTATEA